MGISASEEKYGILTFPQVSVGPVFIAPNSVAKPGNQEPKLLPE